jgi:hypothetical protein
LVLIPSVAEIVENHPSPSFDGIYMLIAGTTRLMAAGMIHENSTSNLEIDRAAW